MHGMVHVHKHRGLRELGNMLVTGLNGGVKERVGRCRRLLGAENHVAVSSRVLASLTLFGACPRGIRDAVDWKDV